jgi:hypothetical protein
MDPNQPYIPPPKGQNPYDFITNPQKSPKRRFSGGNSFVTRLFMVVGGGVLLIIIISVAVSLLGRSGQGNTNALKNLVAEQEELVRVASIGSGQAQDASVRARALTTELSTETQQQSLINYLEKLGIKVSKEELAAQKDSNTDSELESAASSNRFDDTFSATLTELLNKYAANLQDVYNSTSNEETKLVLSDSYSSTATLLGFK